MNIFNWDMRYTGADGFDGMILWWASLNGPKAVPGEYSVRLTTGSTSNTQDFNILKDPRSSSSIAHLQEQFDFLNEVIVKLSETNNAIKSIRAAREQINLIVSRMGEDEHADVKEKSKT